VSSSDEWTADELEALRLERELAKLLEGLTETVEESKPSGLTGMAGGAEESGERAAGAVERLTSSLASQLAAPVPAGGSLLQLDGFKAPKLAGSLVLGPIWTGLLKLLGGDREKPEPATVRYETPGARLWELGIRPSLGAAPFAVDQEATGALRPVAAAPPRPAAAPAPVKVEIHALDSRSILDRSDDLADAIRRALSESHRLSDYLVEE
jgi:hypothetical protein